MNLYVYNIRITTLANAASFNIGTTMNMVQNTEREVQGLEPIVEPPPEIPIPTVEV